MDSTKKLIFVCTSNTCRSPIAAGLGHKMLPGNPICQSRGLTDQYEKPGSRAAKSSVAVCNEDFNIDISSHRSSLLTAEDLRDADVIIGLTQNHLNGISYLYPEETADPTIAKKLITIGSVDIADPWHQEYAVYKACAYQIKDQMASLGEKLKQLYIER